MIADGGIGTYLGELLPRVTAARPDWRFTLLGAVSRLQHLRGPNVDVRALDAPIYGPAEQIALASAAPRADLFWSPHYNIPLLQPARLAVTIHDVAHLAAPDASSGVLKRAYARFMFAQVRRRARTLLFDTAFSRSEFTRHVGAPRQPARVVHLAPAEGWRNAKAEHPERPLPEPYLVYVGNFKQHKNVPALLRAFARARLRIPHRLVLVGRREGLAADPAIAPLLGSMGETVHSTGELPAPDVRRWVGHADALVTASRYEGFGLPPLEAMAAGVPTLVSRAGSLPEICADASLYCDPGDEESIARGLEQVASDTTVRTELIARGRKRAAAFSWSQAARQTLEGLEQAL